MIILPFNVCAKLTFNIKIAGDEILIYWLYIHPINISLQQYNIQYVSYIFFISINKSLKL